MSAISEGRGARLGNWIREKRDGFEDRYGPIHRLAVVVGLIIASLLILKKAPRSSNASALLGAQIAPEQCREILAGPISLGLVRGTSFGPLVTTMLVDDVSWERATLDEKKITAFAAYCLSAKKENYELQVRGIRDGLIKGTVKNGNWISP